MNNKNNKIYSRNSSFGGVFTERFKRTIGDLLRKPVFDSGDGNWVDVLPTKTKHYNKRIPSSTKLTPTQASLKKNEGYVYQKILDKRKKIIPKFRINNLVTTTDLKKTFSKSDTTNWSYKVHKTTEINIDTKPSYRIDFSLERYNEALLKKTCLTMKQNDSGMKKLNII